jgi:uncharacterized protein
MQTVVATRPDVLRRLAASGEEIRRKGVRRLGLFGSFARGEPRSGSDVDILVEFEPESKSFDNFIALAFLLEDLLQRPVELVTAESLSPYLRPHILAEVQDVPLRT